MPDSTLSVILGGGRGERLAPLTSQRSKPAVPLAGKYRLIDIPISNSINSGIYRIYVLTQFNSASLNRHVTSAYRFDSFKHGFVEVLAAEQTEASADWYQGTADAVRKHLHRFYLPGIRRVLILSGDQLYRMNLRELIAQHDKQQAKITVAVIPVDRERAEGFGILKVDANGRIVAFAEKPKDPAVLDDFAASPETLARLGFTDPSRCFLASMGIYLFDPDTLVGSLQDVSRVDFGRDVLPRMIHECQVSAFLFDGYWEDIGTIKAFFEANIALCKPEPQFRFYSPDAPIFTRARFLPASKMADCCLQDAIVADGCLIRSARISESVIGLRTRIGRDTVIRRTIVMGSDFYELSEQRQGNWDRGLPNLGIGDECLIENAIIDKNARIGNRVQLRNAQGIQRTDGDFYAIRDGIIVIPKNAIVPEGTIL